MLPRIQLSIRDPGGLARARSTDQTFVFAGISASGTIDEVTTVTPSTYLSVLGSGHLVDVLSLAFASGLAQAKVVRLAIDDAAVASTTVKTGAGPDFDSFTLTALSNFALEIQCTKAGALGTAEVRWTLDNWGEPTLAPAFSRAVVVPVSGAIVIPGVGTVTLASSPSLELGTTWRTNIQAPHYDATDVTGLLDELKEPSTGRFTDVLLTGIPQGNAAAGAAYVTGLASLSASLFTGGYQCGGLATLSDRDSTDNSVSATLTAMANVTADPPYAGAAFGRAVVTNPRSQVGRGLMQLGAADIAGIRAATSLISSDLARRATGPLLNVRSLTWDARLQGSQMTDARIGALQSEVPTRSAGFFVAKQPLLAASPVTDFTDWQFGAIAKVALDAANRVMFKFLKEGIRQTATATIDPTEIASIESALLQELGSALLVPLNARGLSGHVSDVGATVDPTIQLPVVEVTVSIRPLGYPDDIRITLQYAGEV